jgi:hypothetical protein
MNQRVVIAFVVVASALLGKPRAAGAQEKQFDKGAWNLELTGSYVTPIRFSEDKFYNATIAGGFYLFDGFAINGELQAYYADQPKFFDDAIIGGAGFLLRWHALRFGPRDDFTIFGDAGGGISYADPEVPPFGTHFNFTGKAGVGATLRLADDFNLIGGARYFHLSNGNIHGRDQNPSFDGVQFYLGVMWTF